MTKLLEQLIQACGKHQPAAAVARLLLNGEVQCERLAEGAPPKQLTTLADLQMRLAMWRRVYPRLGREPVFRAAVGREATLWANRLQEVKVHG